MNDQKQTTNNDNLNDLTVADDQQSQIKGGPNPKSKRTLVLTSSATDQDSTLGDLEPQGEIKGGPTPKTKRTIVLQSSATDAEGND